MPSLLECDTSRDDVLHQANDSKFKSALSTIVDIDCWAAAKDESGKKLATIRRQLLSSRAEADTMQRLVAEVDEKLVAAQQQEWQWDATHAAAKVGGWRPGKLLHYESQ